MPKNGRQLNIAVVGCGYWGKNLVRNFSELGVLSAVCDPRADAAAEMAGTYSVSVRSMNDLLQDDTVDGLVIAVPAVAHADLVERALRAKKHVFVEKPMCLKVERAKTLCDLASKSDQILMVGHLLQYHPAFVKLKELVSTHVLGDLQYLYSNRLNLGKLRREENSLWSFAPHDISMILSLVGDSPTRVMAVGSSFINSGVVDVTTTHLDFSNGVSAHIYVSWLHPYKEQKLVLVGSEGMAVFNDGLPWDQKLQIYRGHVKWENEQPVLIKKAPEYLALPELEPLRVECEHFLNCIENKIQPRTDAFEGLRVLEVLAAAEQSMQQRSAVTLREEALC